MKEKTADIDILEEDVKNILNCCTDIETLISLDERAKEDLKNNTHNIQQQEVLTIIREFIRCKNDCSNLIAENKELKEEKEGLKTKLDTLIEKYKELKEEKETDYTSVYLKGVYDERDKWQKKIKEMIEELETMYDGLSKNPKEHLHSKTEYKIVIGVLQELLDERNNTDGRRNRL